MSVGETAPRREKILIRRINRFRRRHGARRLEPSALIAIGARQHARSMARWGHYDHTGFEERANGWGNFGEVVGLTRPVSARRMLRWWKGSPHHREILLDDFKRIGAGEAGGYWCVDLGSG